MNIDYRRDGPDVFKIFKSSDGKSISLGQVRAMQLFSPNSDQDSTAQVTQVEQNSSDLLQFLKVLLPSDWKDVQEGISPSSILSILELAQGFQTPTPGYFVQQLLSSKPLLLKSFTNEQLLSLLLHRETLNFKQLNLLAIKACLVAKDISLLNKGKNFYSLVEYIPILAQPKKDWESKREEIWSKIVPIKGFTKLRCCAVFWNWVKKLDLASPTIQDRRAWLIELSKKTKELSSYSATGACMTHMAAASFKVETIFYTFETSFMEQVSENFARRRLLKASF